MRDPLATRAAPESRGTARALLDGVPSAQPYFSLESRRRLRERLDGILEGFLTCGPLTEEFEQRFAAYVGTRHAVSVSSGTAALYVVLRSLELGGAEVILPTMTCFSCAGAVLLAGGTPRLANIDAETLCLDPDDTVCQIGSRTRAILAVHLGGQILPWIDELREVCRERGLFLLEDAAQAAGATAEGRRAGSFGDAACFSFYPTKIMTTGEGGMITTDDGVLAREYRRFREAGLEREADEYQGLGLNLRLNEVGAAMGLEQLADLDAFVRRRNEIVAVYRKLLGGLPGVEFLAERRDRVSSYWKLYVRLPAAVDRDALMGRMLEDFRVDVRPAYRPLLHRQPALAPWVQDPGRFIASEQVMSRLICLPVFVGITQAQLERVAHALTCCLRA